MNENFLEKQSHTIPAVVSALMLLGALGQWPYGYYQLLRFVVCGVGGYIAFVVFKWKELWAMWLFGFIAVLFNPLIPIHLPREIWRLIDIACALLFATVAVSKGRRKHSSDSDSYEAGKSSHQLVDWAAVTLFLLGSTLGAWGTYHIGFNLLGKEKWDTIGVAILVSMLIGVFFIYL